MLVQERELLFIAAKRREVVNIDIKLLILKCPICLLELLSLELLLVTFVFELQLVNRVVQIEASHIEQLVLTFPLLFHVFELLLDI